MLGELYFGHDYSTLAALALPLPIYTAASMRVELDTLPMVCLKKAIVVDEMTAVRLTISFSDLIN